MERSEGKSPRPIQWDWVLPESQRKRPSVLAASQRDNVGANFISLASGFAESSFIALPLLSPTKPKNGFAGTPIERGGAASSGVPPCRGWPPAAYFLSRKRK